MSDLCDRCTYEGQERCQDGRGYPACMESAATHWKETALTLDKTLTETKAALAFLLDIAERWQSNGPAVTAQEWFAARDAARRLT